MEEPVVLITGGAGYIGSHVAAVLLSAGYRTVLLDNYCNSSPEPVSRLDALAPGKLRIVVGDVRNETLFDDLFQSFQPTAVIHLAGLKSIADSIAQPEAYYDVNIGGARALVRSMVRHGVGKLVFSSSASVYGETNSVPISENASLNPAHPYGVSKLECERIFEDIAIKNPWFQAISLRYFNPVGAHPSRLIGEQVNSEATTLFSMLAKVGLRADEMLPIYGGDWPTPDGTAIRDYVHVMDLADAHLTALKLINGPEVGLTHEAINIGTGRGISVLEAVASFTQSCGREIPYRIMPRRSGDIAVSYADVSLAARVLGWRAKRSLSEMCEDHWLWGLAQSKSPV